MSGTAMIAMTPDIDPAELIQMIEDAARAQYVPGSMRIEPAPEGVYPPGTLVALYEIER